MIEAVVAVVLQDYTENGTTHRRGEQLRIPRTDYDRLQKMGWVGPTGDTTVQDV